MKHITKRMGVQSVEVDAIAEKAKATPEKVFSHFFGDLDDGHTPVITKRPRVMVRSRRRTRRS